jgi:hypothetical protein
MSEHEPRGPGPEGLPPREGAPVPFVRAARFGAEVTAGRAYVQVQEALFVDLRPNLSAYRFLLREVWHVAVIGEPPPRTLARRIDRILAAGAPATLPTDVLHVLAARREQQIEQGHWSEGHYRPGMPL